MPKRSAAEMFRKRYANVFAVERDVERALPVADERAVSLGPEEHLHPGAAVLARPGRRAGPDPAASRRPRAGGAGRFGHDRPHLARRLDRRRRVRPASICRSTASQPADFNSYGVAPRQRPRDDPRHVRQHPHPQPPGPRHRRRRDAAPARRRGDADLRRGHEVQGRGRAAGDPGRRGVRHRQQPRLGRQGHVPARRPRRARRRASSGSTAAISSAWAFCRWSFRRARRGNRSG